MSPKNSRRNLPQEHSLLSDTNNARVGALFAGQGYSTLRSLIDASNHSVNLSQQLIETVTRSIEEELQTPELEHSVSWSFKKYGFNIQQWLVGNGKEAPPAWYLFSAPVAFPLVFLTQLCNYALSLHRLGTTHSRFFAKLKGTTGHSQGVAAAVILSISPTDDDLLKNAGRLAKYLFWQGVRSQETLSFSLEGKVREKDEPTSSPMLVVRGLPFKVLDSIVKKTNLEFTKLQERKIQLLSLVPEEDTIGANLQISLKNSETAFVVSGSPQGLQILKRQLQTFNDSSDQSRIPYSKRKPNISTTFLSMSAPFHSELNSSKLNLLKADVSRIGLQISGSDLKIPVFSTKDGHDLAQDKDVIETLIKMISLDLNDFPASLRGFSQSGVNFIFDFGPSNVTGKMAAEIMAGSGVRIISAAKHTPSLWVPPTDESDQDPSEDGESEEEEDNHAIEDDENEIVIELKNVVSLQTIKPGVNWKTKYAPRVVRRVCDGEKLVETKFSRLIGKPPVMMSGMTPTTSYNGVNLVAACGNAGFHGELAGGGLPLPPHFTEKVKELVSKQSNGNSVSINLLYLNARLWGFQFPLTLDLARSGYPIESITIGAGIPSPDTASEIIEQLTSAGLKFIAFKPGNATHIRQVLEIAKVNPKTQIVLQWTGGRGGGHHSFEDFHQPLLETYAEIRKHNNVTLVIGSGFGDAQGIVEYFDGSWAEKRYGRPSMPVDGVLFGSRCMVAKEAATSLEVKKLIVDTVGLDKEELWDRTYDGECGGVITVQSELGEPIHKIHNRGMACWKLFDTKYFSLPRGPQRESAILADKAAIIKMLNEDFQKVYFGRREDGSPADLEEMTYSQVFYRMIELMYVKNPSPSAVARWIDISYQTRTFEMLKRAEMRFASHLGERMPLEMEQLNSSPWVYVDQFVNFYPNTKTTLLADEDVLFFIELCRDLRIGKPVNFVPIIDESLDFWFKKDSLWCSEELDAIPGCDPQRVCILHGPVAARFSTRVDEPIAEIFGKIHQDLVNLLLSKTPSKNDSLAEIEYLGDLPDPHLPSWFRCAITCDRLVSDKKWISNPIPRLIQFSNTKTESALADLKNGVYRDQGGRIELKYDPQNRKISLQVEDEKTDGRPKPSHLTVSFEFRPQTAWAPLHESPDTHDQIKKLYKEIWGCAAESETQTISVHDTFQESSVLTQDQITRFNHAIGRESKIASLDIATVVGWRSLIQSLFAKEIEGDLLKLVHQSYECRTASSFSQQSPLKVGDRIDSQSRVTSVQIISGIGKQITVQADLTRVQVSDKKPQSDPWVTIVTKFLIRGQFEDYQTTFSKRTFQIQILCPDNIVGAQITSKSWLSLDLNQKIKKGDILLFKLDSVLEERLNEKLFSKISIKGSLYRSSNQTPNGSKKDVNEVIEVEDEINVDIGRGGKRKFTKIGKIESEESKPVAENSVMKYLESLEKKILQSKGVMFENSGYTLCEPLLFNAPSDCTAYAISSGDLNPIHRSRVFAQLANLPRGSPIVHGMWTCALARRILESHAANGSPSLISSYFVEFVGMVFPLDELCVSLTHIGVRSGRKIIQIEIHKVETGEKVLQGRGEVDQPRIAYMFTGQGSASVGMGMDRYEENSLVREVWDTADRHLSQTYGFSILQIVKENPKELTIHFGGPTGKRIRENYMKIVTQNPETGNLQPLMREINISTKSFTFKSPNGLLFSTQFAQPALVLIQKAAFTELVDQGFVPEDAMYAGHSLGEYAALASFADVLTIESLVETVFLRGMVMQNAVSRDHAGRSNFAMIAANPSRVSPQFSAEKLLELVHLIDDAAKALSASSETLLQVVNFNVRDWQYVVAGDLLSLDALSIALNVLCKKPTPPSVSPSIPELISSSLLAAQKNKQLCISAGVPYEIRRGTATIPLAGIDVPFHSRQLLPGVPAFRQLLEPRLDLNTVSSVIDRLVGKYIPNVLAEPFSLSLDFVQRVAHRTQSQNLFSLQNNYHLQTQGEIARTLLVELLAHQFAMPVQWIDTQDILFAPGSPKRVFRTIEMGPSPTLTNMSKKTLSSQLYGHEYSPDILWWSQDHDMVVYHLSNRGPPVDEFLSAARAAREQIQQEQLLAANTNSSISNGQTPKAPKQSKKQSPPASSRASSSSIPTPAPTPAPALSVPPPSVASSPLTDEPVSASHVLKVLLALKFSKPLSQIASSSTIKELSSGKSALQNEMVGEILAEFAASSSSSSDSIGEVPLQELASKFPSYNKLGPVTTKAITKMLSSKLPAGFSPTSLREYLSRSRGLGSGRTDSVLVHALTMQPPSRLSSDQEAKQWADSVCTSYGQEAGVNMSTPSASGGGQQLQMMQMMQMQMGGNSSVVPVPDEKISAKHALRVLLSSKFGKPFSSLSDSSTIKELSSGKSAIQNEVVGEIGSEFNDQTIENAAEMPLSDLARKLDPSYLTLGKVTTKQINKMLSSKLPAGFSMTSIKSYLSTERGLGAGRTDSVLLHALTSQPDSRLSTEAEAKQWLDSVCDSYGAFTGISIPRAGAAMMTGQMVSGIQGVGGGLSGPAFEKLQQLIRTQIDAFVEFLGDDHERVDTVRRKLEIEEGLRKKVELEFEGLKEEVGEEFIEGIKGQHHGDKIRIYDSYWNWVLQDAFEMHHFVWTEVRKLRQKPSQEDEVTSFSNLKHYREMASWITAPKESIEKSSPPQAWFRNFLCNRATPELLSATRYFALSMHERGEIDYSQAITLLAEQVEAWLHRVPVHIAITVPPKPAIQILADGTLSYSEVNRPNVKDVVAYVEEMSRGLYYDRGETHEVTHPSQSVFLQGADRTFVAEEDLEESDQDLSSSNTPSDDESERNSEVKRRPRSEAELARDLNLPTGPKLAVMRKSVDRKHGQQISRLKSDYESIPVCKNIPYVHLRSPSQIDSSVRILNEQLTSAYLSCLYHIATSGVSFAGQVALVTGAGEGSIGIELVKSLLEGGATVIVTVRTSRSDEQMQEVHSRFRSIFQEYGSKGSKLITFPCNCGSSQDMKNLIQHIYQVLQLDLDFVVPFAAIPERGRDISAIDSRSELAHRMMLTNVIRLLGHIKDAKKSRSIHTRPAMVLLPCSPNHGIFGSDGLYSESKLGIESLINKWKSEQWQDYLSLSACVIGWTRSSLMYQNNIVAPGVEDLGCRTFSTAEMAFNLIGLLDPVMVNHATEAPLYADLSGNWGAIENLNESVTQIRAELQEKSKIAKALGKPTGNLFSLYSPSMPASTATPPGALPSSEGPSRFEPKTRLANPSKMYHAFPRLPNKQRLDSLSKMKGMVDPRKVVVVVGFGEVGPWGNSRTRWEMEAHGEFSMEGVIELAWMVGLIKQHRGSLKTAPSVNYIGWVDAATGEPVADSDIKRRYESVLLQHCGIRFVEPDLFEHYDPHKKSMMRQVAIDHDLAPIEIGSFEEGLQYRRELGDDFVDLFQKPNADQWMMRIRRGAVIWVPRALRFNRYVAGQVPTGWDAKRLGVPPEIADSVDPVTLYTLVSTVEALIASGLTDPYELYEYVHVSEVGNCSGGGMGGMRSLKRIFLDRKLDQEIPSDTLAESFINSMPAWVNMLLLSSSGPIKTPVGACATAAESVDIGADTILSGKARVVIVGGYDDFGETGSYEFAQMGATCNSDLDAQKGRLPSESSRPMSDSRAGFVESQGAGIQILMDAELALEMGVPIYAIVALCNTATDRQGRSIPAPGQGILTSARESPLSFPNPLLSIDFRSQQLQSDLEDLDRWARSRKSLILSQASNLEQEQGSMNADQYASSHLKMVDDQYTKKKRTLFETWGQGFYKDDPTISPLRGALAVWNLTVDDISVASFHGTSTKLNDKNESSVLNQQMSHLGRTQGNLLLVVCQKYLTGHPKGAAAAWMLNGMVQTMLTQLVPGNRNLDNVSSELRTNQFLLYPNRSMALPFVDATLLKSFGFGQAGAEILLVHPDHLLASLDETVLLSYSARRSLRENRAYRYQQHVLSGIHALVQVKSSPPYTDEQQSHIYLNPLARASFQPSLKTWTFGSQYQKPQLPSHLRPESSTSLTSSQSSTPRTQQSNSTSDWRSLKIPVQTRLSVTLQEMAEGLGHQSEKGVGIDVEPISTFSDIKAKATFIERNFTEQERAYCESSAHPSASLAGRWAAKEAIVKAISSASPQTRSLWSGADAPLKSIEIVQSTSGSPAVVLHEHAKQVFEALHLKHLKVSISYTSELAVAHAIAE